MTLRDYLPVLEAFALVALVVISAGVLVWYLERRKRERQAKSGRESTANLARLAAQPQSPHETNHNDQSAARPRQALKLRLSQATGRPEPRVASTTKHGSKLLVGCQVVAWVLLIPWILTAVLVWLFPGPSYDLVERWVCPSHSSIQVQGTGVWFLSVLTDDESVDPPQVTCVNSRGAVVFRGDWADDMFAYMRVFGVVLVGFLAILIIAFVPMAYAGRRHRPAR